MSQSDLVPKFSTPDTFHDAIERLRTAVNMLDRRSVSAGEVLTWALLALTCGLLITELWVSSPRLAMGAFLVALAAVNAALFAWSRT